MHNIIEEELSPSFPTPAQTPTLYPTPAQTPTLFPTPEHIPAFPTPAHTPNYTALTPNYPAINPTNPFAYDMMTNNIVNANTEFKPSNIPQGIFHDNNTGNDYQILTPATTPKPVAVANETNPFRQPVYAAQPPQVHQLLPPNNSNAFVEHLHSLQSPNTVLPVLELNSNDLQAASADKALMSNYPLYNDANLIDVTLSFSSLNL